jgi:hypothetical protein
MFPLLLEMTPTKRDEPSPPIQEETIVAQLSSTNYQAQETYQKGNKMIVH